MAEGHPNFPSNILYVYFSNNSKLYYTDMQLCLFVEHCPLTETYLRYRVSETRFASVVSVRAERSFSPRKPEFDPRFSYGICSGESGIRVGFRRVLRFPLPILIPPTSLNSSIIRDCYNRPTNGRRNKLTQYRSTPRIKSRPDDGNRSSIRNIIH